MLDGENQERSEAILVEFLKKKGDKSWGKVELFEVLFDLVEDLG